MDHDQTSWDIIEHLYARTRRSNNYEGHAEHTQPMIAEAVGRARSLVSRKLLDLISIGLVESINLHTSNSRRRRLVYYLTDEGRRVFSEAQA